MFDMLGRNKTNRLRKYLKEILDWVSTDMHDVKRDLDELCRQAEIGRKYLRSKKDTKR